jgi:hypothetical protein
MIQSLNRYKYFLHADKIALQVQDPKTSDHGYVITLE